MALHQLTQKAIDEMEPVQAIEEFCLENKWLEDPNKKELWNEPVAHHQTQTGQVAGSYGPGGPRRLFCLSAFEKRRYFVFYGGQ